MLLSKSAMRENFNAWQPLERQFGNFGTSTSSLESFKRERYWQEFAHERQTRARLEQVAPLSLLLPLFRLYFLNFNTWPPLPRSFPLNMTLGWSKMLGVMMLMMLVLAMIMIMVAMLAEARHCSDSSDIGPPILIANYEGISSSFWALFAQLQYRTSNVIITLKLGPSI